MRAARQLGTLLLLVVLYALQADSAHAQSVQCPEGVPVDSECAAWTYHPWQYGLVTGPITFYPTLGLALDAARENLANLGCDATFTGGRTVDCSIGGYCSGWGNEPVCREPLYARSAEVVNT